MCVEVTEGKRKRNGRITEGSQKVGLPWWGFNLYGHIYVHIYIYTYIYIYIMISICEGCETTQNSILSPCVTRLGHLLDVVSLVMTASLAQAVDESTLRNTWAEQT